MAVKAFPTSPVPVPCPDELIPDGPWFVPGFDHLGPGRAARRAGPVLVSHRALGVSETDLSADTSPNDPSTGQPLQLDHFGPLDRCPTAATYGLAARVRPD